MTLLIILNFIVQSLYLELKSIFVRDKRLFNLKLLPLDNELIKNLRKGNVEAFNLVYKKYAQKLYAFSLKYLKSVEETEELVQSVFLKVWENQQNLKTKSDLFTIVYNEICNLFRRKKYQQEFISKISMVTRKAFEYTEYQVNINLHIIEVL